MTPKRLDVPSEHATATPDAAHQLPSIPSPDIDYIKTNPPSKTCKGYSLTFPDGKTAHSSYPFALHDKHNLPWDYESRSDVFVLRSRGCRGASQAHGRCAACNELENNETLQGIQRRIVDGVKEHSPYVYHGIGGLMELSRRKEAIIDEFRLRRLNTARHLVSCEGALDIQKQIILAFSRRDCDFKRLNIAINNAFDQKLGLHAILNTINATLDGTFDPKSYDERDDARGAIMLGLGGTRVADIAHRMFGTPATSTLRQRDTMPRLVLSPSFPMPSEIERNVEACLQSIVEVLNPLPIVHAVLMFDEIATERRPRWDDTTNRIVGGGRECGSAASVEFRSERDLEMFFDELERGEVRLASEVRQTFSLM